MSSKISSYQKAVNELLQQIPKGKVVTYKSLGEKIGVGPRIIGKILHINDDPAKYPCHRVIKSDGTIAEGYAFGGPIHQIRKLQDEGVIFKGADRVDLEKSLFEF